MTTAVQTQVKAAAVPVLSGTHSNLLQRKCACGGTPGPSGECEECRKNKQFGLQAKLKISEPGDIYEQEADRIADQVLAAPVHPSASGTAPRIQRFSRQSNGQMDAAPASVDQVLATPGRPLEPALRQDMEQRFGHDFSQVQVHTDPKAAESARSVNALAYTVGNNIVFGANQYAPATYSGRRLLGHELAHTIQQRSGTGAPPSSDPHGIFESSAEVAGRDIANGQAVSRDFPACSVGLSRAWAGPDAFDDQELAREIQQVTERLKQPEYEGRDWDLDWLQRLRAVADDRAKVRNPVPAPPPKPAAPPSPPPEDPTRARAEAVAEAEAVIASIGKTMQEDDDEDVTPTRAGAPRRRMPTVWQRPTTLSLVSSEEVCQGPCFTNEQIKQSYKEANDRIDEEISRQRKISETEFDKRFKRAQFGATPVLAETEKGRTTAQDVWNYGIANDLFLPSEREAVFKEMNEWRKYREEQRREESERIKRKAIQDRDTQIINEMKSIKSNVSLTFIQGALVPAAFGKMVGAAYGGTQTGAMVGNVYNACEHGTAAECAEATALAAATGALQLTLAKVSKVTPPPATAPKVTQPTTVRTAHASETGVTFHQPSTPTVEHLQRPKVSGTVTKTVGSVTTQEGRTALSKLQEIEKRIDSLHAHPEADQLAEAFKNAERLIRNPAYQTKGLDALKALERRVDVLEHGPGVGVTVAQKEIASETQQVWRPPAGAAPPTPVKDEPVPVSPVTPSPSPAPVPRAVTPRTSAKVVAPEVEPPAKRSQPSKATTQREMEEAAAQQTVTVAAKGGTPTTTRLAKDLTKVMVSGGRASKIVVEGVAFGDVAVSRKGGALVVEYTFIENVGRVAGQGRAMQVALEQGTTRAAQAAGATEAQVIVHTVVNPKWLAYLESLGYTKTIIEKTGVVGFEVVWMKKIPVATE